MQLRDVVGRLVGLEDERRALAVEAARALADLEGIAVGDPRLATVAESVARLRDDMGLGLDESSSLADVSSALTRGVIDAIRADVAAALTASSDSVDARVDALEQSLAPCLARAGSTAEELGRLRQILARRAEVEAHVRAAKGPLGSDPESGELVDVTLSARRVSADAGSPELVDSLELLADAEVAAASDGPLAAIASNAPAVPM